MIGMCDGGMTREDNWTAIAIIDPKNIIDTATYANPHQYPIGINYVIVNGEIILENGKSAEVLPGKVLRNANR